MILLYSKHITARLKYIVDTIMSSDIVLTDDIEKYKAHEGLKINYSASKISNNELLIKPYGLMEETDIKIKEWSFISWSGLSAFAIVDEADIPFDIFSASFYLLSRYEEYLPHNDDEYGRYHHSNSLAYKHHFLDQPIINLWWIELNKVWKNRLQTTASLIKQTSFKYIPTYDIDIAYQCKGRSMQYNLISWVSSLLRFRKIDAKNKFQYLLKRKDAFDTFSWIDSLHKKHHLKPIYFLLTILQKGVNDKNLYASSIHLQALYKQIAEQDTVGIHPSWQSGDTENLMEEEMNYLQSIVGKPIELSRFHFLRFTLPDYYYKLIRLGIKEDFSMCYGSKNGFRASYTNPFYWYDLQNETMTDLLIHPFSFMEATAHFSEKKTAQQALNDMSDQYDMVKKVNGEFITLFHNHFLVDDEEFRAWRKMYQNFINNKYSY